MKKIKLILLILTLIFTLSMGVTACGGDSGDGGSGDTPPEGPVIVNVEGTKGLAYEVETSKNGDTYAVCTGIGTATDSDIIIASHYDGYVVEQVKSNAFKNNTQIKSVTFVNGMQKINMYAFQNCTELFSVTLCETIESVGQNAFFKCENLLNVCNNSKLEIKMASTQYGYVANYACNIFSSTSGGKGEFKVEGDFEYFTFPNNKYAVKYLGAETAVEIPAGVTGLYKDLFKGSQTLKEVFISSTVDTIGKTAFSDCTSLEKVTIAENSQLKDVASSAFANCTALKEYNFNSDLKTYLNVEYAGNTSNPTYFCRTLSIAGSTVYNLEIPEGVKAINPHAFVNADCVKTVKVSTSVEEIGDGAFASCKGLTSVWFNNIEESKLKIIKDSAFEYCSVLTELKFPKSLESIELAAFRFCDGLTTVTFENDSKLTTINERAFFTCKGLKTVHLGHNSSIKTIGKEAFTDCAKMTEFNMGNNCKVERIEGFAFYQCRKLKEFYVPNTCAYIGNYTFGGCFDGPRNDPKTPYMKIYIDFSLKPNDWSDNYNSSNCPVFLNTPYPTYPV